MDDKGGKGGGGKDGDDRSRRDGHSLHDGHSLRGGYSRDDQDLGLVVVHLLLLLSVLVKNKLLLK